MKSSALQQDLFFFLASVGKKAQNAHLYNDLIREHLHILTSGRNILLVDRSTRALRPTTTGSSSIQAWDQALGHLDPSWEKRVRNVLSPQSPAAAAAVMFISSPAVRSELLCGRSS